MSNIYKFYIKNVSQTNELRIEKLIVYIKNKYFENNLQLNIDDLNKIKYVKDFISTDIFINYFKNDFNNLDIMYATEYNPLINFVNDNIYQDDTIEDIKLKFIKNYEKEITYAEIYFFYFNNHTLNNLELFNYLTDNNKNILTKYNLYYKLLNINEQTLILNELEKKKIYNYNDIINLKIKEYNILNSFDKNESINISNPYFLTDVILNDIIVDNTSTNNKKLLFEENIKNNTIYVVLFDNLINYFIKKYTDKNISKIIKLYFPFIYQKTDNYKEFINYKKDLLINTNLLLTKNSNFSNKNDICDLLNYIKYNSKIYDNKYGFKELNFNIYSKIHNMLSLENIFKILNSDENIPLIKYNSGRKTENIYRLYSKHVSKDNMQVPFLSKSIISKYLKTFNKPNTITLVILNNESELFNTFIEQFVIQINNFGIINVKIIFSHIPNYKNVNKIISKNINNLFNKINKYIDNYLQQIVLFESIDDKNIEIININLHIIFDPIFNKSLQKLNNIKYCLHQLFNITKNNYEQFIYKKVSNYNETNDMTYIIINLLKEKISSNEIIINLKKNFNLNTDDASEIFNNTIKSLQLMENVFNNKYLKIKNNPGFFIKLNIYENNIIANINNIDNINYIKFLILYFDSIFKLLNNLYTINNNTNNILDFNICKKNIDTKYNKTIIDDIEKPINYNDKVNFVHEQNITQLDDNDILQNINKNSSSIDDDIFNLLLNDDDEEDKTDIELEETNDYILHDGLQDGLDNGLHDGLHDGLQDGLDNGLDNGLDDGLHDGLDNNNKNILDEANTTVLKKSKGNIMLNKLLDYEPDIFSKNIKLYTGDDNIFYKNYSRMCQSKRQPIILNEKEKSELDKHGANTYKYIKYYTNPEKKHYYICPKFWDMKNNKILNDEDVDEKKVLSKKNPNGTIWKRPMGNNEKKYTNLVPGFLKDKKTVDDYCVPCCFNKTNYSINKKCKKNLKALNKKHNFKKIDLNDIKDKDDDSFNSDEESIENMSESQSDSDNLSDNDDEEDEDDNDDIKKTSKRIYILGENKFPLNYKKYGELPLSIIKLLKLDNNCKEPGTNLLTYNKFCLLRYGVENNINQSFLSIICDVYCRINKINSISLKNFKEILLNSINIDYFFKCNNGNLTNIFNDTDINNIKNTNIDNYTSSEYYKIIDTTNENQLFTFKKIVNSYQNFINYINNQDIYIDYTYLWDFICIPNKELFINGLNLIIIDYTSQDITDNIKFICPKNNYSSNYFDDKKENLIILKNNNIFEPVYAVKDSLGIIEYLVTFDLLHKKGDLLLNNLKTMITYIKQHIENNCNGKYDNTKYNFVKNKNLIYIIEFIKNSLKEKIIYQIINYENKVIGIVIEFKKKPFFIPCYPSAIYDLKTIPIKFMDQHDINKTYYNSYEQTIEFLNFIYDKSDEKIPVKPKFKIIEDGLLVGILTNGNQFVVIEPPLLYENLKDDIYNLDVLNDKNYLNIDTEIQTNFDKDTERINITNNIKLENMFYNSFKNKFKQLINAPENFDIKNNIKKIVNDKQILYLDKINLLLTEIKSLIRNNIIFSVYDNKILDLIKTINFNSDTFNKYLNTDFCLKTEHDKGDCKLIISEKNLITKENNEKIYYIKICDELIRYNDFKNILFVENKNFLLENINYNINNNEIIIYESNITKNLFANKVFFKNTFENFTNQDTFYKNNTDEIDFMDENIVNAVQTKKTKILISKDLKKNIENINNNINIQEFIENINCKLINKNINKTENLIINNFNISNKKLSEYYFENNSNYRKFCSCELLLFIIKHYTKISLSRKQLLEILIKEYLEINYGIIFLIMSLQYNKVSNKEELINQIITLSFDKVNNNNELIENLLKKILNYDDDFYLSNTTIKNNDIYYISLIDIYIISKKFNIPILFIVNDNKINNYIRYNILITLKSNIDSYYVIKLPNENTRDDKYYKLLHIDNIILFNINDYINNTLSLLKKIKYMEDKYLEYNSDILYESARAINIKVKINKKYSSFFKLDTVNLQNINKFLLLTE